MQTSLVIMAAGIGSRFGGGIKQLTPIGPNGELIIDYSIYDAIQAGFDKIIIILRDDIYYDFVVAIGNRIEKICKIHNVKLLYAFQNLDDVPSGIDICETRQKPWGTGHAVLAARNLIDGPFVVINADDYYGKYAFKSMHDFISTSSEYCMAGFILKNTLSENGGVSRGICNVDQDLYLTNIIETHNIKRVNDCAFSEDKVIPLEAYTSMNMWGLGFDFIKVLENEFEIFLKENGTSTKAEFLLPQIVGKLLMNNLVKVKVIPTSDKWVGVTYREDRPFVVDAIRSLVDNGEYPSSLAV